MVLILNMSSGLPLYRFEIDRLTELLKSRVADVPSGVESRKFEQVPSTPVMSYGKQEGSPQFPAQSQDGVSPHMVPTHAVSANVGISVYTFYWFGFCIGSLSACFPSDAQTENCASHF